MYRYFKENIGQEKYLKTTSNSNFDLSSGEVLHDFVKQPINLILIYKAIL